VFVSTAVYALGHELGMVEALSEVGRQLQKPDRDSLPVVRTIARLQALADVQLHLDCGATYIGMMRSRAFHEAYESGWPAWISLDDDIEATTATCVAMLEALEDTAPRIIVVPYLMRMPKGEDPKLAVTLPEIRIVRHYRGARLALMPNGSGGGFGFVGMNRAAMHAVVEALGPGAHISQWIDGDGKRKHALFYEILDDQGLWYGEDTSFFKYRVPTAVTVEALLVGRIMHAGEPLDLDKL